VLLGTEHGAGAGDSSPANKDFSRNLIVFHAVNTNEGTRATESGLAMHSDSSTVGLRKVLLTAADKFIDNVLWGNRAIHEDEIFVIDTVSSKRVFIVLGVIKAHHLADLQVLKNINVARSTVAVGTFAFLAIHGAHKSHEFSRDDPIEITILDLLIVFILFNAEGFLVVPPLFDTELEPL
jgi:hypothetical protein